MKAQAPTEIQMIDGERSEVKLTFEVKDDRKEPYEVDVTATVIMGHDAGGNDSVDDVIDIVCDVWDGSGGIIHQSVTSITDEFLVDQIEQHCI